MFKLTVVDDYKNTELSPIAEVKDDKDFIHFICLEKCSKEEFIKPETPKEIQFTNNTSVFPCVNYNAKVNPEHNRQTYYLSGAQNSGKSYCISLLLKSMYKKYKNEKQIILFTNKDDDEPQFQQKGIAKISKYNLDNEITDLTLTDLQNTITIFDDIDGNQPKIYNELLALADNIILNGRKHDIDILISSHKLADGNKTKYILNNIEFVFVFPISDFFQTNYFMEKYLGVTDTTQRREILEKVRYSRFACFRKFAPRYLVYDSGVILF